MMIVVMVWKLCIKTSPKRVARSIRSLDALNKVNTHLIRWLFNETFINEGNETTSTTPMTGTTRRQQAKAFMNNNQKRVLNSMMLSKARRNEIYQKVIDEFLKVSSQTFRLNIIIN